MNEGKISDKKGLTFDDLLLLPNYSQVRREEVDLSSRLTTKLKLKIPLISSPMDTVTNEQLAVELGSLGGLGVIHRSMKIEDQAQTVKKVKQANLLAAAAVGTGKDLKDRVEALEKAGLDIVVLDSAHGYSENVLSATEFISNNYPKLSLISGNVATASGAKALIERGAQAIRVGMGPGSICTTRIVSGMGVPQITAVMEAYSIAKKYNVPVISDGGIRYPGDIVKAIAAGASTVMIGSLFAGCKESPGTISEIKGKKYKHYRGMGSLSAMKEGSAIRYGQNYRKGQKKKLLAEGVEGLVSYKGTLEEVVNELIGGLRAGMYYTGVGNISDLQTKTRFIKVTSSSLVESHPHDILINKK